MAFRSNCKKNRAFIKDGYWPGSACRILWFQCDRFLIISIDSPETREKKSHENLFMGKWCCAITHPVVRFVHNHLITIKIYNGITKNRFEVYLSTCHTSTNDLSLIRYVYAHILVHPYIYVLKINSEMTKDITRFIIFSIIRRNLFSA